MVNKDEILALLGEMGFEDTKETLYPSRAVGLYSSELKAHSFLTFNNKGVLFFIDISLECSDAEDVSQEPEWPEWVQRIFKAFEWSSSIAPRRVYVERITKYCWVWTFITEEFERSFS